SSRLASTSGGSGSSRRPTSTWRSTGPPRRAGRSVAARSRSGRCRRRPRTERGRAVEPAAVERAYREASGRAVAILTRRFGDLGGAGEAVQEAFVAALRAWPASGVPPSLAGWIVTTARNRAIDRLRREADRDDRQARAALLRDAEQDPSEMLP